MKLIINKSELQSALKFVNRVIMPRTLHPVLSNLRLKACQSLAILGTNQDTTLFTIVDCHVIEEGEIAIPAKKLDELVNSLSSGDITLEKIETRLQLTQGKGKFLIAGCEVTQFPQEPSRQPRHSFTMESKDLIYALDKVGFALANDITRANFSGILLKFQDNKLTAVATDGQRLAIHTQAINAPDCEFLLPKAMCDYIKQLSGGLTVEYDDNKWITIKSDNEETVSGKCVNEKFPDYSQVIPENNTYITVETDVLLSALCRIVVMTNPMSSLIRIRIADSRLQIEGKDYELGTMGSEELAVFQSGEGIELGLSGKNLVEVLKHIGTKEVKLTYKSTQSAVQIIEDNNYQVILMPLRLSGNED